MTAPYELDLGHGPKNICGGDRLEREDEHFRKHVRQLVIASSGSLVTSRADILSLFAALVAGRCTLVDRFSDGGLRYLVAEENSPESARSRCLTPREREIVLHTIGGRPLKTIAFDLGITPSTAAAYLAAARRKTGLESRAEMVRWFSTILSERTDDDA